MRPRRLETVFKIDGRFPLRLKLDLYGLIREPKLIDLKMDFARDRSITTRELHFAADFDRHTNDRQFARKLQPIDREIGRLTQLASRCVNDPDARSNR